jgi:lipid II:glycine glycyltransferase (peptidoglycan interpeptide bridge formation enzyme)
MTTRIELIERNEWQNLAVNFMDYNYCQLWDYGIACAGKVGAHSEHVAIYEGEDLIGLADVRVKEISVCRTGIAYINSGPLVRQGDEFKYERLQRSLSALKDRYVAGKKLVLRIQPLASSSILLDRYHQTFLDAGFRAQSRSGLKRTIVLDISPSLDAIRQQFHKWWRRNLNYAKGLVVVTDTNDSLFSAFCQIYRELVDRKGFEVHLDANFYRQVQQVLSGDEKFIVTIIYENGLPVAGHVYSLMGDTCIDILAATTGPGLKNGASYQALWSVIQKAKEKGCHFYDLSGIDPEKNPGGYQFKRGTGGIDIVVPAFEIFPNWWSRRVIHSGEWAYRHFKKVWKS